jgi:hypothetical protein
MAALAAGAADVDTNELSQLPLPLSYTWRGFGTNIVVAITTTWFACWPNGGPSRRGSKISGICSPLQLWQKFVNHQDEDDDDDDYWCWWHQPNAKERSTYVLLRRVRLITTAKSVLAKKKKKTTTTTSLLTLRFFKLRDWTSQKWVWLCQHEKYTQKLTSGSHKWKLTLNLKKNGEKHGFSGTEPALTYCHFSS